MTMVEALSQMMAIELRALRLEHSCESHIQGHPQSTPPDACIGLDTWAPNINLNRDPRWGRNWEVASECPYLTGKIGEAYSRGFQSGIDDRYLLGIITLKHWAAYNVEENRGGYDAIVSRFDLGDSYLAGWRTAVVQGKAAGVMCSYNAINGVPTCASNQLNELLRETWQFDGYVTSDSGAISDIYNSHKYTDTSINASALAIEAGCDINSGGVYESNVGIGLLNRLSKFYNETAVNNALANAFRVRMRLGLFDPPDDQPYEKYKPSDVGNDLHHQLSKESSLQGITMYKNDPLSASSTSPVLPLARGKHLAIIGANAETRTLMAGGTGGGLLSAEVVCKGATSRTDWWCIQSPADAINASNSGGTVNVSAGASIHGSPDDAKNIQAAVDAAKNAEAVIFVVGGDWSYEHEGMDRSSIAMPGLQAQMISQVAAAVDTKSVPLIAVLVHGGSMDISPVLDICHSVIDSFYPGMHGGTAIAETIFGDNNPGGKLPYTMYKANFTQRISMNEFSMAKPPGRGYRYLSPTDPDILLPFGTGLSYTTFSLSWNGPTSVNLSNSDLAGSVNFSVAVQNIGSVAGTETVLGYFAPGPWHTNPVNSSYMPLQRQLFGFEKVFLKPGEKASLSISLDVDALVLIDVDGSRVSTPGLYNVFFNRGTTQSDIKGSIQLAGVAKIMERLPSGL